MKRNIILSVLFGSCLFCLAACSDGEAELEGTGSATFRLETKAEGSTPRLTRLYLAERLSEHANTPGVDVEGLHCELDNRYFIEGNYWHTQELFGQWYKFAFVNVPNIPEVEDWAKTMFPDPKKENLIDPAYLYECDFNKLYVDFTPIIDIQEEYVNDGVNELADLSIYRKNIDRWVDPNNPTSEDVTLTRVTGELVLDMGIPSDQFEHPVSSISIHIPKLAYRLFIRDGAADSVWVEKKEIPHTFIWKLADEPSIQNRRQTFRLTLLPDELTGAEVEVGFHPLADGQQVKAETFPLQDNGEEPVAVQIKKNKRTRVLFNGMGKQYFEVRYAGFDDNASIDVEDDNWNGPAYEEEKGGEDGQTI